MNLIDHLKKDALERSKSLPDWHSATRERFLNDLIDRAVEIGAKDVVEAVKRKQIEMQVFGEKDEANRYVEMGVALGYDAAKKAAENLKPKV